MHPPKTTGGRRRGGAAPLLALLAGSTLALARPAAPRDLDVAVPPGSPLDWSRSFPAITPARGPLFPPMSPSGAGGPDEQQERSSSEPAGRAFDVQSNSSFGLVRILTWDLAAHLLWVRDMPPPPGSPRSGSDGFHPPLPEAGEALYWMTLAPLLRLMLHPAAVSRAEVLGHLVEIGEPTLAVLSSAKSERALAPAALELEVLIRPGSDDPPKVIQKEDPTAAMRSRLVFEELSTRFAADPVAGFGDRMFLLGEELVPEVVEYTRSENAFVRRNAVAALGRFRSAEAGRALLAVATETKDAVCLIRALNGLGRLVGKVDATGLVARLETTNDPVLVAALCSAAGRARLESAVPRMMALAERALTSSPRDSDVLIAVLTGLCELRPRAERDAVLKLVSRVHRDATREQREYALAPRASFSPDTVDPMEMRAEIVDQLALVLEMRLKPGDSGIAGKLLALRDPLGPGPTNRAFLPVRSNDTLGNIHPPVRFLYIATLAECGEKGAEALREIARDGRSEAAIRGYALMQMPWHDGTAACEEILSDPNESADLRIQAFEAAANLNHPKLKELGLDVLTQAAALEPGGGAPAERYLALSAVRALSLRGLLGVRDLLPLLAHVKSPRSAHGDLPEEVRALAERLVENAALGAQRSKLEPIVDELLDLVIAAEVNEEVTDKTRSGLKRELGVLISDVKARKQNTEYLRLAAVAIVERLLGWSMARENRAQGEFLPRVLLEEEILLALGRCREPMAVELLLSVLANPKNRHRAVACLALGMLGRKSAEATLARYLLDGDPFVRFAAAQSLAHLAGGAPSVDWMYGSATKRLEAAEAWRKALEAR